MFLRMLIVVCRFDWVLFGRLIWVIFLVIMILDLKFRWVRNIFICLVVVFCVLFRMMNVLFRVLFCMYVSGVILMILVDISFGISLGFIMLYSVL